MRPIPENCLVCDAKNPALLVGEPGDMSGTVHVRNREEKRLVITGAVLRFSIGESTSRKEAEETECRVRMMAVVAPGQSVRVPITTELPGTTPPGKYQGVLALGTSTYPVKLLVTETIDVVVAPSELMVPCRAGRYLKTVFVSNDGNVPVTVGRFGAIPLDDELAACRIIRATLQEAPENTNTINDWATRYLRKAGEHLKNTGLLWVDADAVTIEPGATKPISLTIRVPDLPGGGRFVAILKLYDANIEITLVPTGTEQDPKDSSATSDGATKDRRSK